MNQTNEKQTTQEQRDKTPINVANPNITQNYETIPDKIALSINKINNSSKTLTEITNIATDVISQKPDALENEVVKYFITSHFGEKTYQKIQNIYQNLIA